VQAAKSTATGAVVTRAGAGVTVKVASQVTLPHPDVEAEVNVTVFDPPQISGAPVLLFVSVPLVALAVAIQLLYAVFSAAWLAKEHEAALKGVGHVTVGNAFTVTVALPLADVLQLGASVYATLTKL